MIARKIKPRSGARENIRSTIGAAGASPRPPRKSAMIEFFFHEDNTYIIRAWPAVVREYGSHEDQLVWKIQVSRVNGKVLQDITIQEGTDIENFVPLASPDGKYIAFMGMCEAEEGDPLVQISVYEIVKGDIFATTSSSSSDSYLELIRTIRNI